MTAPRALKVIGAFREMGYDDDDPSLVDARGKRGSEHKEQVVSYLRSGTSYIVSPGPVADFFNTSQYAGTAGIRTDGVYAWPDFLAHYVERYDVELPADFEQHMRANNWTTPRQVDLAPIALPWEI
jgi:hypothetical protein